MLVIMYQESPLIFSNLVLELRNMQIIKDYSPGLVMHIYSIICYLIDSYLKSQNILLSLAFII